jgi:hypothetical protein
MEETIPKIKEALNNPVLVNGRYLKIPVDYKFGKSWGSMEEVKTK